MTTAVLDASVVVELVLGTRVGARVRERLLDPSISLHGPELLDLEVLNVLRRYVQAGTVAADRAEAAIRRLDELDLQRHRHGPMLPRVWSRRANLTAYDAAYVALAEVVGGPLLTMDARLSRTPGLPVPVELFGARAIH